LAIDASAPQAAGIRWDLSPLFADAAAARANLDDLVVRCRAFETSYRGTIAAIDAPGLAGLLAELAELDNGLSRVGSYAHLRESVDVTDDENLDLSGAVDRTFVEIGNALRFFELEWLALPEDRATRLTDDPSLAADRHYLVAMRRFGPHTLSEPEERMLSERAPAATGAWHTLYSRITSTLETSFDSGDGEEAHGIDRLLSYMRDPRRQVRHDALKTLYSMLEPHAPVLAHCYDTLVGDRLAMDKLRSYTGPMDQTHLRNELGAPVVDGMLDAVARNYPLAQRWFVAKAKILGLDTLELHDQYAPIGQGRPVEFAEAVEIVTTSFHGFSPRIAAMAQAQIDDRRVDAEPRNGKRGGAFCSPVAHDANPYVLMNWTDQMNDVLTMSHEFGHGMHFQLANERQTPLSSGAGIAMCEVASTFAEHITYDYLLANEADPATRHLLACERVEGAFATIFRQAVLTRYEQAAYEMRAEGSTLTAERLGDAWWAANSAYYGDAVAIPERYRLGWSYIPHFIHTRFYTYSYTFALLVSLALYARYRRDGDAFVGPYLDLLAAGGSGAPAELLAPLGLDLGNPSVWDDGFAELERMIDEAQAA
jgi:oligoendopeptidase F